MKTRFLSYSSAAAMAIVLGIRSNYFCMIPDLDGAGDPPTNLDLGNTDDLGSGSGGKVNEVMDETKTVDGDGPSEADTQPPDTIAG